MSESDTTFISVFYRITMTFRSKNKRVGLKVQILPTHWRKEMYSRQTFTTTRLTNVPLFRTMYHPNLTLSSPLITMHWPGVLAGKFSNRITLPNSWSALVVKLYVIRLRKYSQETRRRLGYTLSIYHVNMWYHQQCNY
jgi:hypothetical protein